MISRSFYIACVSLRLWLIKLHNNSLLLITTDQCHNIWIRCELQGRSYVNFHLTHSMSHVDDVASSRDGISDYSRLLGSLFLTSHFQIVFKLVVISISQQFMRLGSAPSGASKGFIRLLCEICRPLTCQQILKCCSLTLVCWAVSWYIYRQNMCVGARDCQRPCCANIFFPSANINWYIW